MPPAISGGLRISKHRRCKGESREKTGEKNGDGDRDEATRERIEPARGSAQFTTGDTSTCRWRYESHPTGSSDAASPRMQMVIEGKGRVCVARSYASHEFSPTRRILKGRLIRISGKMFEVPTTI